MRELKRDIQCQRVSQGVFLKLAIVFACFLSPTQLQRTSPTHNVVLTPRGQVQGSPNIVSLVHALLYLAGACIIISAEGAARTYQQSEHKY